MVQMINRCIPSLALLTCAALLLLTAVTETQAAQAGGRDVDENRAKGATTEIYCGKNLTSLALFRSPNFKSPLTAPLNCGQRVTVLSRAGDWVKIRTDDGVKGYEPTWFVGPPASHRALIGTKCKRPSPLDNIDQFDRLKSTIDGYIDLEKFTPQDFKGVSRDDIESLAASSYLAAYMTAEKPGLVKAAISKSVVENQVFSQDFAKMTPIEQINLQVWLQKVLTVLSRSIDLGYADGSKFPCNATK